MTTPSLAETTARQRHVTWGDPHALAAAAMSMDGMAFLQALLSGALPPPPMLILLGIAMTGVTPASVTMTMPPGEHLFNPLGTVHGGALATLLDSVMGCAVISALPPGKAFTTLEIKVNYIRAMTLQSGVVTATGTMRHLGGRTAVAEAEAHDAGGRLLATASSTCMVIEARGARGATP